MAELSTMERLLLFYGTRTPSHPRKWWLHELLRRRLQIHVDREMAVVRGGIKWGLNPSDYTDESLFWLGSRDSWDLFHLRRLLDPGAVIFDVGANFGYYSMMLAVSLDSRCRIFAFEPHPDNRERLKGHVEANGLAEIITMLPWGVSDREETARMHRPVENSGHAAIDPHGESTEVRLAPLDALYADTGVERLDLLILDVEGYEERALRGARGMLARFKPMVFVELFPPVMKRQGASAEATAALLTDLGYRLFVARKSRLTALKDLPADDARENVFGFHETKIPRGLLPGPDFSASRKG